MNLQGVLEVSLVLQCVLYVVLCPYTKVEESFNLQAIHDLLYHGTNLNKYDHYEFPGVVPRSFIGPLVISGLSYPLVCVAGSFGASKLISQYIVRSVLGVIVCLAMVAFSRAVRKWLGPLVATFTLAVTMVQFHFLFYASRTLPNTFALAVVLMAYRYWVLGQHWKFLCLSGLAIIVFRTELSVLLGLMLLGEVLSGRLSAYNTINICVPAGAAILGLTVVIDSYFWKHWLWPEGAVLWYNTVLNKSSQWGTSPFLWYFYSALPRACLVALPLGAWGAWKEARVRGMFGTALLFVLAYSFLPHKELRFIVYTFPLINVTAAAGIANLWIRYKKFQVPIRLLVVNSLIASLIISLGFLIVSTTNYPGGVAMDTMHKMATKQDLDSSVSVHIDVEPAQTGVSRFTEINPNWRYLKTEGLAPGSEELLSFDIVITSITNEHMYSQTHEVVAVIEGFGGFRNVKFSLFDFVNSLAKPSLIVLRRMRNK